MATCSVCGHLRTSLLCPDCFAASCVSRRSDQRALAEQRDAAAAQLAALVADKVRRRRPRRRQRAAAVLSGPVALLVQKVARCNLPTVLCLPQKVHQRQQLQLLAISEEVRCTQARAVEAEQQLAAVRQRLAAAQQDVAQRQAGLAEARQHLTQLAAAHLWPASAGGARPAAAAFDQQVLACQRVEAVLREQRARCARGVQVQATCGAVACCTVRPHAFAATYPAGLSNEPCRFCPSHWCRPHAHPRRPPQAAAAAPRQHSEPRPRQQQQRQRRHSRTTAPAP